MRVRSVHDIVLIGLLSLGLTVGVFSLSPTEAYANLITTNPGFETDANSDNEPDGWTAWDATISERSTAQARSGSASAKCWAVSADTGGGYYQDFSASVGQVYVASVWVRSLSTDALTNMGAFVKLEFRDASGILKIYESNSLTSSNSAWERHTAVGIAPPGTTTVRFNCAVWTTSTSPGGSAYFDDADLHQVTTSTLYIDSNPIYNEGFETSDGGTPARPQGWGSLWSGGGGTGQLSTTYVRTGTYSLRLGAGTTDGGYAGFTKTIPVQQGQVIELTAYCKTDALDSKVNAYLKIDWYGYDNNTVAGDTSNTDYSSKLTGTNDWTQLSAKGVGPPNGTGTSITFFARLSLTVVDEVSGAPTTDTYAYFDDVEVKVTGGFGQKRVKNTPEVVASSTTGSWQLTVDQGWGGYISSYYDYNVGTGATHMVPDYEYVDSLFKVFSQQLGGAWVSPVANQFGELTVIEQSPTRAVFRAYGRAIQNDKSAGAGDDYWTTTYTVYPDGRIFITTYVKIGDTNTASGPYWIIGEDYDGYQAVFAYVDNTTAKAAYLDPDADGHDAALWVYEPDTTDWFSTMIASLAQTPGAGDKIYLEYKGNGATSFGATATNTHHWMMDIGETAYTSGLLGTKGSDYKTHTSGSDLAFETGSLVTNINSDANTDGYDEGAGCWNVAVSSNSLEFTLNAATQSVTRYKPAFFITGYTDNNLPAIVKVDDVEKEQGTDYNMAFVPFSKVYERYNTAQNFSTFYAEGFNNKNSSVSNPDYAVNVETTDYASCPISTTVTSILDLWGFDFGSKRDIATCTVYVTYYTTGTVPANNADQYGFITDLDLDGTFGETTPDEVILALQSSQASQDTTSSLAITSGNLTDDLVRRRLEIRAQTKRLAAGDSGRTLYWKNAYISGTYYADDVTDAAASFNTATAVFDNDSDYLYVGSLYKFSGILVDIYIAAEASGTSTSITPAFQYYDSGTGWTTLSVTDNTNGFQNDGMITFTAPANWAVYDMHDGTRYIGGDLKSAADSADYANLKLYYVRIQRTTNTLDANTPQIYGVATNNLIFQYMSNVTTDSYFSFTSATLVDMLNFDAIGYFGKVKLSWTTGSELNNAGFNILRSEDGKNYVKINPALIEGLGTSVMGREYSYEDTGVVNGKAYYYILEDVEKTGKVTKHGPVAAHPGRDFDGDGMTDDWEYYYGLPATIADANVDSDDDGLTNLEEFLAGTNPLVIDSETLAVSQNSGVSVIESEGLRTVLELNTSAFKVTNKNVDGVIYHAITLPEYTHGQTTDVGKPQIPTKGVLFGTLSKKPVTINVLETEKEAFAGYNVYPVAKAVLVEDPNDPDIKRLTYEFYKDTNAYAIDAFYPGTLAEVDYSNYLQDQQVVKIIFHPIRFNPVKGTLEFYKRIRLEVVQEGAESTSVSSTVTPKSALPLTEDNAYKIYITEDGIYRLTKSYLESMGISLAGVAPTKLKIYNKGAEIPIYIFGEEDGLFDASDYVEFYAEKVDTRYTGTNVYWLVLSDESGLRMTASEQVEVATTTPGSFLETYRKEDNALYWMEAKGEDRWFIDAIYGSQVYDLALNLDGVANTASEATVKIALEGSFYSGNTFAHHLYVRLNGYPIADVSWAGYNAYTLDAKVSQSYLNEGANTVTLEVADDPTGYEEIIINWVEVSYLRKFAAKDNVLSFGNYTDGAYSYKISGFTTQDVAIYDITDANAVKRITQFTALPEGTAFEASFNDIGSKEYIVLAKDKAKLPYGIARDEASSLAYKSNRADYIIITHSDFYDTISAFADYRSKQGLQVKVAKLDDIYDEFNYGIADVAAIKDFLKYAYYNWTGPKPAYVLLVGDATFDFRDYSGYGFTNYVPTYFVDSLTFGETGSDNWFVCFDGDNDIIPDMLIGRFPVKTTAELESMINKIVAYESISPDEKWTKKVLFVADNGEGIFIDTSEGLASYLTEDYVADKQYLGTTTNRPDVLRQNIINSINDGRLFVNYAGHGGIGLWANERIFTWDDVKYLYNQHTLPVFTTLTCANGYFVYPRYAESLGERLVNDADGGAIASFVSSGISYPTTQAYLANGFYGAYFNDGDAILGSMVARAKLSVFENESGNDARNVIQTYNLFGDPALKVRIKAPQIPAVAAPKVFNLEEGKVNQIFRLTDETQAASTTTELGTVIVSAKDKDLSWQKDKKGLTKIIQAEEEAATPSRTQGSSENKVVKSKELGIEDIQLEDKTVASVPPKWRALSKPAPDSLHIVKPSAKIDYGAVEENVTAINKDAQQLTELRTRFDEAVKAADFQQAKSILRVITKLARKIYWRTF